jgi:hypothetical protein
MSRTCTLAGAHPVRDREAHTRGDPCRPAVAHTVRSYKGQAQ